MEQSNNIRLHAIIKGRVQGVGFRYFVQSVASKMNISGWVLNTPDGNVEVTAEGKKEVLETFLSALKTGPRSAEVTAVEIEWHPARGDLISFLIERTGK